MTRIPQTKSKMEQLRARKAAPRHVAFQPARRVRYLAGGLSAVVCLMFVLHQTQIDGAAPLFRGFAAIAAAISGTFAWFYLRRAARKGPLLTLDKQGFGIAIGFERWLDFTWDQAQAFRYYEPTGLQILVKRRNTRWVGVLLADNLPAKDLSWDVRLEIFLNTFQNRPGLCIHERYVDAPILDVLQAFKDYAPKALDDYNWMER